MSNLLNEIRWFCDQFGELNCERNNKYVIFEPRGSYSYAYLPEHQSTSRILKRIRGDSLKRRTGSALVRLVGKFPWMARSLPWFKTANIRLPDDLNFDVAIASYRVRLIDRRGKMVWAFSKTRPETIYNEITARKSVPDSIKTPAIVDCGENPNFFVEQLVSGSNPPDPSENIEWLFQAYKDLQPMYAEQTAKVDKNTYWDDIMTDLRELDQDMLNAIELTDLDLPEELYMSQIHGDLHADNILTTDDGLTFLDWELSRNNYIIIDIFRPLFIDYHHHRNPILFKKLVENSAENWITREIRDTFSGIAWSGDEFPAGLPILYLLLNYESHQQTGLGKTNEQLLSILLSYTS